MVSCPSSSASTFRCPNEGRWLPNPIRLRGRNIPIPRRKSSTLKQQNNENSLTLPGGIVHFRNLDTQALRVGPSFLGVKKERPAIAQPRQGTEHGVFGSKSLTFTPAPIATNRKGSSVVELENVTLCARRNPLFSYL